MATNPSILTVIHSSLTVGKLPIHNSHTFSPALTGSHAYQQLTNEINNDLAISRVRTILNVTTRYIDTGDTFSFLTYYVLYCK